jgi:hypothetical protein
VHGVGRRLRKPIRQKRRRLRNNCERRENVKSTEPNTKDERYVKKQGKKRNEESVKKNNGWEYSPHQVHP